ncbi:MAG: hypothetical protein HY821_24475 [Acidobacteria bacterium]|nr:hypothetical protein [Acidobacteriota bacterium]
MQLRFLIALLAANVLCFSQQIGYHEPKTDTSGRIVPWYGGGPSEAYDFVVRATFRFWLNIAPCPNGVPYYLQHQVWAPNEKDRRALGGDQIPMALSSWNLLHGYLGDTAVRDNMVLIADYWLDHGMSAPNLLWPNLPYPYNTELHSGIYDGDMRAGKGFLQPDKAASFGAELVTLYKITGQRKYLDAAIGIADTLAARIQPGDATHSPWPYRVHAATDEVHSETRNGAHGVAAYTTNYTSALQLFDDLTALRQSNAAAYLKAKAALATWLKKYPLKTNNWGPFFEDIHTSVASNTEYNADTMAAYLLDHPEFDPNSLRLAKGILDWSLATFENKEYQKWGVLVLNEQTAYLVPGNSHTARHAAAELRYGELTGDHSLREDAIRRLNWATYTVDKDGKNRYIRSGNWLTDGYGDYIRHYLRAMAALPELAPANQNHLLRTSSVIRSIDYGAERIAYDKFDARSTERFKLAAWRPRSIRGGKMQWDAAAQTLTVTATSNRVELLK